MKESDTHWHGKKHTQAGFTKFDPNLKVRKGNWQGPPAPRALPRFLSTLWVPSSHEHQWLQSHNPTSNLPPGTAWLTLSHLFPSFNRLHHVSFIRLALSLDTRKQMNTQVLPKKNETYVLHHTTDSHTTQSWEAVLVPVNAMPFTAVWHPANHFTSLSLSFFSQSRKMITQANSKP